MSDAPRFDEIVHAPNRLQICAILSAVDSADFAAVREGLGVADSVLSKHIRVLHEAGYIEVRKATCASRSADQPGADRGRARSLRRARRRPAVNRRQRGFARQLAPPGRPRGVEVRMQPSRSGGP